MIINSMKNGQFFQRAFTTENAGIISLDILPTAKAIEVTKVGAAVSGKDSGFVAKAGDWAFPTIYAGGASGALTLAKKELGVISFSTDIIKLAAGKVTKSSGLEIDFAGFAMPKVGDSIVLSPLKRIVGDDYIVNRSLFVISVSGTKAKVMKEVPTAMAIDSTEAIYAKVSALHGRQAKLKYGIDVSSVSREGDVVSLVGSHSKLIGMTDAMGGLKIDEDSKLIVPMKKRSGQQLQFTILSMNEGVIKVRDTKNLIATTAIGAKIIGTAHVVPIGGYTLVSAVTMESYGASKNVSIDLNKLTGAAAGDVFIIEARYGGDI